MLPILGKLIVKIRSGWWSWTAWTFVFTLSFILPLIIQSSLNHTIILTFTMNASRFNSYMSQLEILAGANQLRYRGFGQLQLMYILELSNSSFPKWFSPTSISWYPSICNWLLLDFCLPWKNTIVDCILETKDFVRWWCIWRLKVVQSLCIDYRYILFEMIIFYTI